MVLLEANSSTQLRTVPPATKAAVIPIGLPLSFTSRIAWVMARKSKLVCSLARRWSTNRRPAIIKSKTIARKYTLVSRNKIALSYLPAVRISKSPTRPTEVVKRNPDSVTTFHKPIASIQMQTFQLP